MKYRGGCRIGSFNVSWPLVVLSISNTEISVKVLFTTYKLTLNEVEKISTNEGMFSPGIEITTFKSGVPRKIIFWNSNQSVILEELFKTTFRTKISVI
jgi:hypothetical protein